VENASRFPTLRDRCERYLMKRAQCGMTLVELVITIVIVGIAAGALYSAMGSIIGRSADPLLRQQSLTLAEGYLEEIALQAFGVLPSAGCTPARACFNDVRDYDNLSDSPPRDALGNQVTVLAGYRAEVNVQGPTAWNGVQALRIDVTVTDPAGQLFSLTGYRTCYGEAGC
jgi:MSHA pilin protein MshD